MTAHHLPARERGFTLIELIVALGILAMTASLLTAGIAGTWYVARDQRAGFGDSDVAAAQRILRARIERLTPVTRDDSSNPVVQAEGDQRLFSFIAPPLDRLGPDTPQSFRLLLTPAGDLVLFSADSLDDRIDVGDRSLVGWRPNVLLSGARELEITYFGPSLPTGGERWQAVWSNRPRPPALVRVRVRFGSGDRRVWPDLVVRPRTSSTANCRVLAANGDCGQL
jgi:general secretion pathway protein J